MVAHICPDNAAQVRSLISVPNIGEFERGRARASASEQLARSLALKFWLRSLARQKSSNSQLARSRSLATFFREVQLAARVARSLI